MSAVRNISLQGVENVRDLGGIPVKGKRAVASGLLYRGSALSVPSEGDIQILFGDLGIRCVVDLRCGWERKAKPDVNIPGVENLHIPFYDLDIVGIEYTRPAAGTKAVGRDVACDPDHYYRSLANPLTVSQMRKAVHAVLSRAARGQAVYHHCSGGKDRSGILALLILTCLGASRENILVDYLATNIARDKNPGGTISRFQAFTDGDERRAQELAEAHRARPQNLDAFYEAIDERYGSMGQFIRNQLGLDNRALAFVRSHCTVEA